MLQRTQRREPSYSGPDELHWTNGAAPRRVDLHDIYTFVKSNWRIIAAWTIVAVALALGYAFTATPLYTATVELALNSRKVQAVKEQVVGENSLNSSQVESEVTILRSESIALAVVKQLKLTDDPEFVDDKPGLFSWLFGGSGELSDELRTRIAVSALRGGPCRPSDRAHQCAGNLVPFARPGEGSTDRQCRGPSLPQGTTQREIPSRAPRQRLAAGADCRAAQSVQ